MKFCCQPRLLILISSLILAACSSAPSAEDKLQVATFKQIGMSHYKDRKFESALAQFNRALKITPKDESLLIYHSLALYETGSEETALKDLKVVCERLQNNPSCFASLSYLNFRSQKFSDSIFYADRALLNPDYSQKHRAFAIKGACYLQTRKPKLALNTLKPAFKSHSGNRSCVNHMLISRAYLHLGKYNPANQEAELAQKLCPSKFESYEWLAYTQYKSARFTNAMQTYREAKVRFRSPEHRVQIKLNIEKLKLKDALDVPQIIL